MTESYFQDIIIPSFAWLVFAIILGAFLALVWRTYRAFKDDDFKLRVNETLGLPKGTIRSFIIITFTAIMFLIFFGDIDGVEIPVEDRKWFLTAYASLLAFYFGSKYLPDRTTARGLVISSISTPVGHPPTGADSVREAIEITGNGFESPKSVAFNQDGHLLSVVRFVSNSQTSIDVDISLTSESKLGAYDIIVELANGSRIVKTSGYSLEKA